jgi:predicted AlkP superfamily phosphohydrolase/phosphomutase
MRGALSALAILLFAGRLAVAAAPADRRVVVVGIDGLDPKLLQTYMDEGSLPNFRRLATEGAFKPLQTSMPPLSPIAWSTFITGMDPGGHGIYDFIHRDPATMIPTEAMVQSHDSPWTVSLGSWVFPLVGGRVENQRRGRAFWQILEEHGVPTTVYKMPANYPPVPAGDGKALSGMGTPDIVGTAGTFSYYTDRMPANAREFTGGNAHAVRVEQNHVSARLHGPQNSFRRFPRISRSRKDKGPVQYESPELVIPFDVYLDPQQAVAKFVVQENEFILREGEWSEWTPVRFEAVPLLASVGAIGRFYLKQVRPDFQLYVTPLQIDPAEPAQAISDPESWSHDLCEELGYFYTKELPADTKAFTYGILDGAEFWTQSQFVQAESEKAFDLLLRQFREGLLFFYFSSVDQGSHMLWAYGDERHPAHAPDPQLAQGIETLYREIDGVLGRAMAAVGDDTTLVVMSDHGFNPFYWEVNLNTWLLEKGYVTLKDPTRQEQYSLLLNVDWDRTKAYALGLNGLYVNLKGREKRGIVEEAEYQALVDRLERDLLALEDPRNGQRVVTLVVQSRRDFHGPHAGDGPDIIVGYNRGYRSSWTSPLGEFRKGVIVDNRDRWGGDHAVDYRHVPGVLLTNRRITLEQPALYDLTVAILDEYGIAPLPEMIGKDCLAPREER